MYTHLTKAVLLELGDDGLPTDLKSICRPTLVVPVGSEGIENQLSLQGGQFLFQGAAGILGCLFHTDPIGESGGRNRPVGISQDHDAFDLVFELPDVPRPIILPEHVERRRLEGQDRLVEPLAETLHKKLTEDIDVLIATP